MRGKRKDLTGMQFGNWIVLYLDRESKNKNTKWICKCNCKKGKIKSVFAYALLNGDSMSCGCKNNPLKTKHGMYYTRTYKSWTQIIQRCKNPNNTGYEYYGGRGITVCDEWLESFENFYEDMGECPEGYSIERIDVNGNYCKDNCKWITMNEQQRNKRNNVFLEYNGESKCVADWARCLGIKIDTLWGRIRRGLSIEEIFKIKEI